MATDFADRSSEPGQGRPLRVLITVTNLGTAGSKGVIARLVSGLDPQVVEARVAVAERTRSSLERVVERHVAIEELPLRLPLRPWRRLWRAAGHLAEKLRGRFDLVHSFDYSDVYGEGLAVRRAGIPWVVEKTNLSWNGRAWWVRCALARRIVCHSRAARDVVPWPLERKCVDIPLGLDLSRFEGPGQTGPLREAGVRLNAPRLVCVADLVRVKGHLPLLEAFSGVLADHADAQLVLVGDGDSDLRREIQNRIRQPDLENRAFWLGRRDDVPSLLPAFDGLVLPTRDTGRREAFGQVVVEAMAASLPVVATRCGGPEEIVVDGETGWLVEAEGSAPLAEGIGALLSDPERARVMGLAGRRRAEALYDLDTMLQAYVRLWRETAWGKVH